jgi:hypothetical protein
MVMSWLAPPFVTVIVVVVVVVVVVVAIIVMSAPSCHPHPHHSLFPPHEQLLAVAVGGAVVAWSLWLWLWLW